MLKMERSVNYFYKINSEIKMFSTIADYDFVCSVIKS